MVLRTGRFRQSIIQEIVIIFNNEGNGRAMCRHRVGIKIYFNDCSSIWQRVVLPKSISLLRSPFFTAALQPLPSESPSWISRGDVSLLSASFSTVHPPSFSLSSGNPVDPVTRFYLLVIPRRAITRWVTAGKLHMCKNL